MKIILIIIGLIALGMLASAIDCATHIDTAEYTAPLTGVREDLVIACISDLHGWRYGKDNCKLLSRVKEQAPDLILIAGDMITRHASDQQVRKMNAVIKAITDIAPVYYATGNHEADYMAEHGMELLEQVAKTGAHVLYDGFEDLTVGESTLRIGAASGRYFDGSERDAVTLAMLEEIGKDGIPAIAVVHQPENVFRQDGRDKWTAGLYISGHTHGGVWRIPGLGGVMSPAEGLFPKYDRGFFRIDGTMPLIINGGLSGYYFIPRIFNRPEICRITIEAE